MGTHRQTLLYDFPARETLLGSEVRVDSDHLMTGSFSLILKDVEKRAPTGITDGFRKGMVLDHPTDGQVLNHDMVIGLGVLLSCLEMEVSTLTGNLEMGLGRIAGCLAASLAALLASAQLALFASKCLLRGAIVSWVLYRVSLRVGKEDFQTHVNADIRMIARTWKMFGLRLGLTHDESVPMPVSTQYQMDGFRGSRDLPVQLDLEKLSQLGGNMQMFVVFIQPDIT